MNKLAYVKALLVGAALAVLMAPAAFAQTAPTRDSVRDDVISEATPYFTTIIGVVVTLFGLALLVTLARKAAAMAKGGIRKG